jgi:C4-dicarboxylate transporter
MIEPQRLYAVSKTLTGVDQFVQLLDNRHLNGVGLAVAAGIFIAGAEEVGIKDRGTPFSRSRMSA